MNPLVSVEKKKEIVDNIFSKEIDTLIVNFIKVLVDKSRFGAFDEVLDAYNIALDNINNISRIHVTSAVQMSDDAKAKLKNKLETKLKRM